MTRRLKRLLVAGAAGFIGSNFVRHLHRTRPDVEITVLDKLTYAGNLANLAALDGQPGYRFVHGDICDEKLVDSLAADTDAIVNFAAETHVDRSLMDPFAFVDACEKAASQPDSAPESRVLRDIQAAEFELLLKWFCLNTD